MYTTHARALRRCKATKKDGTPCKAYAIWGRTRCTAHTYAKRRRGKGPLMLDYPTNYEPCTCSAYNWPHRPGSGICRWPDVPFYVCTTPKSTHSWPRTSGTVRALIRAMRRHGRW
jgi:hypothetical protein